MPPSGLSIPARNGKVENPPPKCPANASEALDRRSALVRFSWIRRRTSSSVDTPICLASRLSQALFPGWISRTVMPALMLASPVRPPSIRRRFLPSSHVIGDRRGKDCRAKEPGVRLLNRVSGPRQESMNSTLAAIGAALAIFAAHAEVRSPPWTEAFDAWRRGRETLLALLYAFLRARCRDFRRRRLAPPDRPPAGVVFFFQPENLCRAPCFGLRRVAFGPKAPLTARTIRQSRELADNAILLVLHLDLSGLILLNPPG